MIREGNAEVLLPRSRYETSVATGEAENVVRVSSSVSSIYAEKEIEIEEEIDVQLSNEEIGADLSAKKIEDVIESSDPVQEPMSDEYELEFELEPVALIDENERKAIELSEESGEIVEEFEFESNSESLELNEGELHLVSASISPKAPLAEIISLPVVESDIPSEDESFASIKKGSYIQSEDDRSVSPPPINNSDVEASAPHVENDIRLTSVESLQSKGDLLESVKPIQEPVTMKIESDIEISDNEEIAEEFEFESNSESLSLELKDEEVHLASDPISPKSPIENVDSNILPALDSLAIAECVATESDIPSDDESLPPLNTSQVEDSFSHIENDIRMTSVESIDCPGSVFDIAQSSMEEAHPLPIELVEPGVDLTLEGDASVYNISQSSVIEAISIPVEVNQNIEEFEEADSIFDVTQISIEEIRQVIAAGENMAIEDAQVVDILAPVADISHNALAEAISLPINDLGVGAEALPSAPQNQEGESIEYLDQISSPLIVDEVLISVDYKNDQTVSDKGMLFNCYLFNLQKLMNAVNPYILSF